jgi:excisionase family DNA binding protein
MTAKKIDYDKYDIEIDDKKLSSRDATEAIKARTGDIVSYSAVNQERNRRSANSASVETLMKVAYEKIAKAAGRNEFLLIADLRDALPNVPRDELDAELLRLRDAGTIQIGGDGIHHLGDAAENERLWAGKLSESVLGEQRHFGRITWIAAAPVIVHSPMSEAEAEAEPKPEITPAPVPHRVGRPAADEPNAKVEKLRAITGELYTVEQVAAALECPVRTIQHWIKTEKLRGIKIGGIWRVKEADFKAFTN